jgi:hypothetical protein
MVRFEKFIQEDLQKQLREVRNTLETKATHITNLMTTTEAVDSNLKDLELRYNSLTNDSRQSLSKYEEARAAFGSAFSTLDPLPLFRLNADEIITKLDAASREARTTADNLSNPKTLDEQLRALTTKRKERELLRAASEQREILIAEISRLKERQSLENVKAAAATGPLTNKILEFSENNITEIVRDTFTREADRLYLERVTIAKTRAEKGILLHQPKLVGARQNVTLPRVFSEGERTALGLAGFLTEAHLDASKSALILDDPVTSLDHLRRSLVAERLAKLATNRQVVVFTHDVAFVADLKREAKGLAVAVAERSVSRGRAANGKPGACGTKHPWKAKDVPERINELRQELARIKKEYGGWDETTYENQVATWAGNLSETWERIFSQEIVGGVVAEGGLEVRPNMVKVLTRFSSTDEAEFQASYSRVSQWAKRHDKSTLVNYVAPGVDVLQQELELVNNWFKRVKKYRE